MNVLTVCSKFETELARMEAEVLRLLNDIAQMRGALRAVEQEERSLVAAMSNAPGKQEL